MGPLITGPTAAALADGRDRFNALYAVARRAVPTVDDERFTAHLARHVQPVVDAAEAAAPGSAPAVTEALYEASLDLLVHGMLGAARRPGLADVWDVTLPAAASQLAADPRRVVAALCNGVLRVASTPGGRAGEWALLMAGAAGVAPGPSSLLEAGIVAAWRAGLAHARAAALEHLARLPPEVAAAAIGAPALDAGDVAHLAADRWWRPADARAAAASAATVRVVARVGSFRGFGGVFLTPPHLAGAQQGTFLVEGGTGRYVLCADAFGATLQRAADGAPSPLGDGLVTLPPAAPAFVLAAEGTVTSLGDTATFPALAGATSWVSSADTLAVTTANSHAVTLVALGRGVTTVAEAAEALAERWRHRWPDALALWSRYTRLAAPHFCPSVDDARTEGLDGSFAMIRLVDKAVVICLELISSYGLEEYALEILGHEVGHHVLCPADLTDQGRLVSRLRWGIPGKEHLAPFLGNLYADLLINDRLQRSEGMRMGEVFRHIGGGSEDRFWTLYLRIYEVLWELPTGTLCTGDVDRPLDVDAQLGARLLRAYSRRWLDAAGRFAALCYPYLEDDASETRRLLAAWRDAEGTGGAVPAGLTDIEPGEREGAVHPALDPELAGLYPDIDGMPSRRPSTAGAAAGQLREPFEYGQLLRSLGVQLTDHELAVRYYRELASRHLVPFPRRRLPTAGEALPEGVEPWSLGSPLEDLDFVETAARSPVVVPGMTTVQRTWGATEGVAATPEPLDLDLYVDCSGSMPNPQYTASWLTVAGAIVALSALRAGGRVQATLWSGARQFTTTAGFVRDESEILRVLTGYFGGGTAFPVHMLRTTYADRRPTERAVHIFVISDDGVTTMFDHDELGNSGWDISAAALATARGGGTLALGVDPAYTDEALERAAAEGWSVARVGTFEELVVFCRDFSRRTFGDDR